MRVAWCTDIHLNFLTYRKLLNFYESLVSYDAVIISGDTGESSNFDYLIHDLEKHTGKPVYFVLGNHDYYGDSVESVRLAASVKDLLVPNLHYLTLQSEPLVINQTSIVGVDGWADTRAGNYKNSDIQLNDSRCIFDLSTASKRGTTPKERKKYLGQEMRRLADADTRKLIRMLKKCTTPNILIVTHVPPFEEVCNYRGKPSGDDFLPFYCNKKLGLEIAKFAGSNPLKNITVLCGHTHGYGVAVILPYLNLVAKCGESDYNYPTVSEVLEL